MKKFALTKQKIVNAIRSRVKTINDTPSISYNNFKKDFEQAHEMMNYSSSQGHQKYVMRLGLPEPRLSFIQHEGHKLKEVAADKLIDKQHMIWDSNFRPKTKEQILNALSETYKHKNLTDTDFQQALKIKAG